MHKDLLVRSSGYFEKATTGIWTEAQTGVFRLVEEDVQVFELFVQWLYSGRIEALDTDDLQEFLVEAWSCGQRLQAREFQNAVINMLFQDWAEYRSSVYPNNYAIAARAYATTMPRSTLRTLIIDKFSAHAHSNMLDSVTEELPSDLLADMTQRLLTNVAELIETGSEAEDSRSRLEYDICERYHEHKEGSVPCTGAEIRASYRLFEPPSTKFENLAPFEQSMAAEIVEN